MVDFIVEKCPESVCSVYFLSRNLKLAVAVDALSSSNRHLRIAENAVAFLGVHFKGHET